MNILKITKKKLGISPQCIIGIVIAIQVFFPIGLASAQDAPPMDFPIAAAQAMGDMELYNKLKAEAAPGLKDKAVAMLVDTGLELLLLPIVGISSLVFSLAGFFMESMGLILDFAIARTINTATYANLAVVNVGWTAVRDFSNMFFIFALLFISIKTILGLAGGSTKRWVANLIIAAILINFSLFFTKVVIDAGNVLAMGFWQKITVSVPATAGNADGKVSSASQQFLKGFRIQTAFDGRGGIDPQAIVSLTSTNKILIYLGGSLVMFIAGYVFLAGAIMMVLRTIKLLFLMIVSPFAFLGFALPVGGGWGSKWFSELIASAFVAPAFLAMLYLDAIIINSVGDLERLTGGTTSALAPAFTGSAANYSIILNFILLIMLLLASLKVADAVSSGAGSSAGSWAKKGIGVGTGLVFAGGAMAGRQSVGRAGKSAMKNDEWVKEQNRLVARAGMKDAKIADKLRAVRANALLATAGGASKATFDARNSSMVSKGLGLGGISAGAGTKKSYATTGQVGSSITGAYRGTDKEKELIETAKARYDNPAAQKSYMAGRGVELDAKRNKDVKKELDRGIATEGEKETIKSLTKEIKLAEEKHKEGKFTDEQLKAEGDRIAELLKGPLSKLSGKESTEYLTEEQLRMPPVIANLQSKDLAALTLKAQDLAPETIAAINGGIGRGGGTTSAINYMKNQAKVGGPLAYDAKADLTSLTKEYDTKKRELGDNSTAFKAYAEKQKVEIEKALGMLGGKDEFKGLSEAITTHEVVRDLTKKVATVQAGDARDAAAARSAPKEVKLSMTPEKIKPSTT